MNQALKAGKKMQYLIKNEKEHEQKNFISWMCEFRENSQIFMPEK